jgi:hypothetical protein
LIFGKSFTRGKKKKVLTENKSTQNRPKRRKKNLPEPARLKTPKKETPKERERRERKGKNSDGLWSLLDLL